MNFTLNINVTSVVEVVAEVAEATTGTPNALNVVTDFKKDIRTLTNLTRLVEQTPVNGFTENLIAWDAIERLLVALGLDQVLDVEVAKEYVQSVEDTLTDPEQLLVDYLGFNLTETVETALDQFPDVPTSEELENYDLVFSGYLPILDVTGPFAFYPRHCYPSGVDDEEKDLSDATKYNSPVIAYVRTGASIE